MKLDDLVKELGDYLDILNIQRISTLDGDALSRLAVKLASYSSTLGQYVAQAEREYGLAELDQDLARERIYKAAREDSRTIADSESLKRSESQTEAQTAIERKYEWRTLAYLRSDVSALIDTLRSRLSYLKSDRDHTF